MFLGCPKKTLNASHEHQSCEESPHQARCIQSNRLAVWDGPRVRIPNIIEHHGTSLGFLQKWPLCHYVNGSEASRACLIWYLHSWWQSGKAESKYTHVLHMFADVTSRSVVLLQVVSVHHQLSSPATQCRTLKDTQAGRHCLCIFFSGAQSLHIDGCAWFWNPLTYSLRRLSESFGIRGFSPLPTGKTNARDILGPRIDRGMKTWGNGGCTKAHWKGPNSMAPTPVSGVPLLPLIHHAKVEMPATKTSTEKTQGDPSFRDLDNEWVQTDFCDDMILQI